MPPSLSLLQQALALATPIAFYDASISPGWQGTSGGSLVADGTPAGLIPDLSQLGGVSAADYLASATELITNGGFDSATGWTLGGTATISGGTANLPAVADYVQQAVTLQAGKTYRIAVDYANMKPNNGGPPIQVSNDNFVSSTAVGRMPSTLTGAVFIYTPATQFTAIRVFIDGGGVQNASAYIDNLSIKEFPGNHLRAGTWASPSDTARATYTTSGGVKYLTGNASNQYYSLLNAISVQTDLCVMMAVNRTASAQNVVGFGTSGADAPSGTVWKGSDNIIYGGLGNAQGALTSALTTTGNMVLEIVRDGTNETLFINGAQSGQRSAATVSGTLATLLRSNTVYTGARHHAFVVLAGSSNTGSAARTAWRQYLASLNGASVSA